jgi:uncharacterized membrane protein
LAKDAQKARIHDQINTYKSGHWSKEERITIMLYAIAVVLIVLWLLGMVTSYTMSGFIHVLLVIAIVVVLLRVIRGRGPLSS